MTLGITPKGRYEEARFILVCNKGYLMARNTRSDDQMGMEAKEDSSLTLPLTIIGVTLLVSAGFLYYYFGPSISKIRGNVADFTESEALVQLTIEGQDFRIPANYTRYPKDRRGGVRDRVALYALLPDFEPYSPARQEIFETDSLDSPVIYFEIGGHQYALDEKGRFDLLYKERIVDLNGTAGPDGLTRYEFDGSIGYKDVDVFTLDIDSENPKVIRCNRQTATIPMPDCRREDIRISKDLSVSYWYKRHWLADWRVIDQTVLAHIDQWLVKENNTGIADDGAQPAPQP